jgi:hypothetical protein
MLPEAAQLLRRRFNNARLAQGVGAVGFSPHLSRHSIILNLKFHPWHLLLFQMPWVISFIPLSSSRFLFFLVFSF